MTGGILIPTLFVLAIVKFALVVLWFMHLKFDDRRYARFFVMGLAGASVLYLIVLISFRVFALMVLPPFHVHLDVLATLGGLVGACTWSPRGVTSGRRGSGSSRGRRHRFLGGVAVLLLGAELADPRPRRELPLQHAHGAAHALHVRGGAAAAHGDAGLDVARAAPPGARAGGVGAAHAPLVALMVANGVLFFIHWPEVVSLSVRSELAHFSLHTLLLGSAIVMWWPVLSPLPELPALSRPGQLLYLFFQSLAPTIPASFLTFGRSRSIRSTPRSPGSGASTRSPIS